jgi:hypothetical protein
MKIRHLNLLLTYKCPSQCRHCGYFCGLEGGGLMTASDVNKYLQALKDHPLESLWIYGGEPFLYPQVLTEVVKIAGRWNIPRIGIMTNGYWGKNDRRAEKRLSQLKEAGLNAMVISTDGFHAERVSPDVAINATRLARDAGLDEVSCSVAFIRPRSSSNPYNDESERIWARLDAEADISLREDTVTTVGRAAEELLECYRLGKVKKSSRCHPPGYIGGTWDQPEGLEIDPGGWVMLCPGLSLGRTGAQSLSGLLRQYDQNGGPLWKIIRRGGPPDLLDLALEKGYQRLDGYAGLCHLCYHVRKFLQPFYSAYLAPLSCYHEHCRAGRRTP